MKKHLLLASIASLALLASCGTTVTPISSTSSVADSSVTSSVADSSISVEETYTISVDSNIKGGVISLDKTSAKKGETITVTVTAEENKELKELTSSVAGVSFTTVKEGETYTFIMPEGNITISATFISNSLLSFVNVSPDFLAINDDENVFNQKHNEGDDIYFEIKAAENGVLPILDEGILEHIYVHVGSQVIRPKFAEGGETTGLLPVSFKMPADATTVYIAYSVQQHEKEDGHTVTFDVADGFKLLGVAENTKYDYLNAYLVREEGYSVTSFQWKYNDESEWNNISYKFTNNITDFAIRPMDDGIDGLAKDITIKVEGQLVGSQAIEYTNASDVNFYTINESGYGYNSTTAPDKILVGETVSFYVKAISSKHLKSITLEGVDYTPEINASGYTYISFVMPNNKVTITFNCEENGTISVTANDKLDSVIIKNKFSYDGWEISSAAPGETFYVIPTAKAGYEVIGGSLNGGEMQPYQRYEDYESMDSAYAIAFVMPESGNAVITLTIGETHSVTTNEDDNVSFSTYGKTSYAEGNEVKFSVNPGAQYNITEVKVHKVGDESTTVTVNYDKDAYYYPYSFIMPSYDVVIEVVKTEKEKKTVSFDYSSLSSDVYESITINHTGLRINETIVPTNNVNSVDLYLNEDITIEVVLKTNAYSVNLSRTESGETSSSTSSVYIYGGKVYLTFDSFKATSNLTNITLTQVSKTATTATVTDSTNGAVTALYSVNDGAKTSTLPALYENDVVKVYLTTVDEDDTSTYGVNYNGTAASSGTEYDDNFNAISYFSFTVDDSSSINIEFVKSATYTLTVNNPLEDDYGISIMDYGFTTYSSDPVSFKAGATQYVYLDGNYDDIAVDVVVSVGGTTDTNLSKYNVTSWNATLTFNADIVITVSEA